VERRAEEDLSWWRLGRCRRRQQARGFDLALMNASVWVWVMWDAILGVRGEGKGKGASCRARRTSTLMIHQHHATSLMRIYFTPVARLYERSPVFLHEIQVAGFHQPIRKGTISSRPMRSLSVRLRHDFELFDYQPPADRVYLHC
jgi:hypothetical protein